MEMGSYAAVNCTTDLEGKRKLLWGHSVVEPLIGYNYNSVIEDCTVMPWEYRGKTAVMGTGYAHGVTVGMSPTPPVIPG